MVGSVVWEVIGEIVFFALVALVSWLVYEELRWPFILVVFLGVNAVLVVIALAVWLRRRRPRGSARRRSRGSVDRSDSGPDSEVEGDEVRNRTGR